MKVAILAGGVGSRLAEETEIKPKPMVEIGGRPILWHIMKHYSHYGYKDFVIALGYKGEVIKKYMVDYCSLNSDLTVRLRSGKVRGARGSHGPDWTVDLVDTGISTLTGGRIKRCSPTSGMRRSCSPGATVSRTSTCAKLLAFHRSHGKLATLTAVRPPARFGHLVFEGDRIDRVLGETADGRRMDQRSVLRSRARGVRLHRRRRNAVGAGAHGTAGGRRTADGLSPYIILAVHGHAARQETAGRTLAAGRMRPGKSGRTDHARAGDGTPRVHRDGPGPDARWQQGHEVVGLDTDLYRAVHVRRRDRRRSRRSGRTSEMSQPDDLHGIRCRAPSGRALQRSAGGPESRT